MQKKSKRQTTKKGADIPIPKRGDFFKNLKKAATPSATNGKTN